MAKLIIQISCLYLTFLTINCREICYDKYGCFTDTNPFGGTLPRPIAALPEVPSKINPLFRLYNRKSPQTGEIITPNNQGELFNPSLQTKVIIHGFFSSENSTWFNNMKDAFLELEDMNVMTVDWSVGASTFYTQAVANTQLIGRMTAEILIALMRNSGLKSNQIHIIGHSLGAHTAGYITSNPYLNVSGIDRITGLDPASPYFEHTPPEVRLDAVDATFVDIIHTDSGEFGSGLGLLPPIGHVDFYINNGRNQPGCSLAIISPASYCSHKTAYLYFIDSISNKCKYHAYPCSSYADFLKGGCVKCDGQCNRMGYWASRNLEGSSQYLNSNSVYQKDKPVCKEQYRITLKSPDMVGDGLQAKGVFSIRFKTANFFTVPEIFDNSNTLFKQGSKDQILFSADQELTENIESVYITYKRNSSSKTANQWVFEFITIFSGSTQKEVTFCPKVPFYENIPIWYAKC